MSRKKPKKLISILYVLGALFLTSCASPAMQMTDAQIAALSDDSLCDMNNNYRSYSRVNNEILKRNINCDRHYRECLSKGNQPGTQAMDFCMDLLRQNERLKYENDFGRVGVRSGVYTGVGFGF
jgi:hypothetical protein